MTGTKKATFSRRSLFLTTLNSTETSMSEIIRKSAYEYTKTKKPLQTSPIASLIESSVSSLVDKPIDAKNLKHGGKISMVLGPQALPCLNSHISIENPESTSKNEGCSLSTSTRKTAFILTESVRLLTNKYGISRIGFLTLTFADNVQSHKKAQSRFNSLVTNVIKDRYAEYVGCVERQKSGRIHYHLLVVCPFDIRTGFDFDSIEKGDYSSASPTLRQEWAFWRKTAPLYRFGRTELLPVKTNMEAMAKYVGKYIGKHMDNRKWQDKGARLVRYSRGAKAGTNAFMFVSAGSADWRRKIKTFAAIVQERHPETKVETMADLTGVLGPRWAYNNRDFILSLP